MIVIDVPQKSPQWLAARAACISTASDIGAWIYKNDQRSKDARRKRICEHLAVGSSRVDLQACKLEYSIVSPK